jgi:RPA family protein
MQERQVARKLYIKTINSGKFVQIDRKLEEDRFIPNYIEINGEKISRVRVLATVIDKFVSESGDYAALTLDDTTDTIRCKIFGDLEIIENIEKGDLVDVIGKVREYNEEIYIQPEIIVKITDPNLEVLRKLEIEKS